MSRPPPDYFSLKETKPHLGDGSITSTHDLVEHMQYLYVHVVKARDLSSKHVLTSCDPYVEVLLRNYTRKSRRFNNESNPDWNQVFAIPRDQLHPRTILQVNVMNYDVIQDDFMGLVVFDLTAISKRVPPDSHVASQWYRLRDREGNQLVKGEIMLAMWWGSQADEAFDEAWDSDAADVVGADALANICSKVYHSPKLWYLRVNVIEAQDIVPSDPNRSPEVFMKAVLGHQTLWTKVSDSKSRNPVWYEQDLMFVVVEPFEELILTVEDRVSPDKDEVLGMCAIRLQYVDCRLDNKPVNTRWFNLLKNARIGGESKKEVKFASRIHTRICLEGGYHVLDEPTHYSSDFRPTAKQLWKNNIGVLEVGIISAYGLSPMKTRDGRATTDAYCVAKYGPKWCRTRTIIDSFNPKWNEQYTWEVFDPCTVITIGVFDNFHLQGGDSRIGKVRIRLLTLETGRVHTHLYPLIVLHPSGVKKMGEIHLAVRFTCSSLLKTMYMYSQPLLPKLHYILPLSDQDPFDSLSDRTTRILSIRLSEDSPPLRKEDVEYMLEASPDMWSMRRSKANIHRIVALFSGLKTGIKWLGEIYKMKNPITTVVIHIIFFILAMYPKLIVPSILLSLFLIGAWNYRHRPRKPPHIDTHLSQAHDVDPDELDEEFDTFPTSHRSDDLILSMRYDRPYKDYFRRFQRHFGDIATQGERVQSLLRWRDPIATSLFVFFCLTAAIVLYVTPFFVMAIYTAIYVLTHLCFQNELPSVPVNFFRRLPSKTDSML